MPQMLTAQSPPGFLPSHQLRFAASSSSGLSLPVSYNSLVGSKCRGNEVVSSPYASSFEWPLVTLAMNCSTLGTKRRD
jgi:hypothetical protein